MASFRLLSPIVTIAPPPPPLPLATVIIETPPRKPVEPVQI